MQGCGYLSHQVTRTSFLRRTQLVMAATSIFGLQSSPLRASILRRASRARGDGRNRRRRCGRGPVPGVTVVTEFAATEVREASPEQSEESHSAPPEAEEP
jgi:hypothetical protein